MKNHWSDTKITTLLNVDLPIIQAPMAGGATTPELVAAVSNAGGLGSLGAGYMAPDEIRLAIKKIRALTHKPFAINLFIPENHQATNDEIDQARMVVQASCAELNVIIPSIKPPYAPSFEDQMSVILEEKIPIFSFTFGIPSSDWIKKCKDNNIILVGTATTLHEAKLLEQHHIDAIVAQGSEAGGHRGTFIGTAEDALMSLSSLTALLYENITVPIIAAGGIMNARAMADVLALGASAVQMGTVFLSCLESGIHPHYKKLLLNLTEGNTALTRAFSGKLARGITNEFMIRMQSHESSILDYPIQNALTQAMRKEACKQNKTGFMSLWAGQSAYLCKELSATQLVQTLNNEMIELIRG